MTVSMLGLDAYSPQEIAERIEGETGHLTVFVDIKDPDGLRAECLEAAWMGYTGKITIHPSQIDIVNEAFTPSADDVDEAARLVEAFAEAEADGRMAISFEGKMVDVPHLTRARKTLARAEQIARNKSN